MTIEARIAHFKGTLSSNLLAPDDFIDWKFVSQRLKSSAPNIAALQAIVDEGALTPDRLRDGLLESPGIYPLLLDLLAFNSTGAQVEKWGFPQGVSRDRVDWLVEQLYYVGIGNVFSSHVTVADMLKIVEIYKDANRRRFRGGKALDEKVQRIVGQAIKDANAQLDGTLKINSHSVLDATVRRSLPFVITRNNRAIAGIATVFQNQSGGRQQRDLSFTYPNLQQRLADQGIDLVLIADGQGLREASDRTLSMLFEGVRYPLNLDEAASGWLRDAIIEAATTGERPEPLDFAALNRLIEEGLRVGLAVEATRLPVDENRGRLALSRYAESRRTAALSLSSTGEQLAWTNAEWVQRARHLRLFFTPKNALDLFVEMLNSTTLTSSTLANEMVATLEAPPVPPFADVVHVTASGAALNTAILREVGRRSMEAGPYSNIAFYLTADPLSDTQIQQLRKDQILLPANVIVVSSALLEQMASNIRPLERLIQTILAQSDLTKVSPFILSNPTSERMFYGREAEAATVQRTLATNSVAILGSRRIGKTSLIRRLRDNLERSNSQPFFADCQTVRTWADFSELAKKTWEVTLPDDFRPLHLTLLIEQLQGRASGPVVVILDEIDQLIDWDQNHSEDVVPEAFFRACRSISQAGVAQFVFSGERKIANRLWDAQSPHWNFCRAVQLTQLEQPDAIALLVDPLRSMNIQLPDQEQLSELAWKCTSGHPQIVQFLGDRLVRLLDSRDDRRDLAVSASDVAQVIGTTEFAQHYLSTYWGQATKIEKTISELIVNKPSTPAQLLGTLANHGVEIDNETLLGALRMLELYGIISMSGEVLSLRAEWFPNALAHFNQNPSGPESMTA